jgi:hypothetical protein
MISHQAIYVVDTGTLTLWTNADLNAVPNSGTFHHASSNLHWEFTRINFLQTLSNSQTIVGVRILKTVSFTLLHDPFRLLSSNCLSINKWSTEIIFYLTKANDKKKVFQNVLYQKSIYPRWSLHFICVVTPAFLSLSEKAAGVWRWWLTWIYREDLEYAYGFHN